MSSAFGYTRAADIEWRGKTPFNRTYNDIYYNYEHGFAESSHVFIHGNHLTTRWQTQSRWTIAETGFGSALNFATCCYHWQKTAPKDSHLTYISFESHPLASAQIAYALSQFTQLENYSKKLTELLPPLLNGTYLVHFAENIQLILHYGDARNILPQLRFSAHAWFLDGFAPSRNPQLWSRSMVGHIARCSAENATLATYSVARSVRESLQMHNFAVYKSPGFAAKRFMLRGTLHKTIPRAENTKKQVAVIGGGLSGMCCAHALLQKGIATDVFESAPKIASRASRNTAAIVFFKPELYENISQQFKWAAYVYALSVYTSNMFADCFTQCGLLYSPSDNRGRHWLKKWLHIYRERNVNQYITAHTSHRLCNRPALYFPRSGQLNIPALCSRIKGADIHVNTHIDSVARSGENEYLLQTADGNFGGYSHVIFAANAGMMNFSRYSPLLRLFKGQVDRYARTVDKNSILCSSLFMASSEHYQDIGASFEHSFTDLLPRQATTEQNYNTIAHDFSEKMPAEHQRSWCDVRTATSDYMPLSALDSHMGINSGFGGKGSLMIPLCAYLLAEQIAANTCLIPQYRRLRTERFS